MLFRVDNVSHVGGFLAGLLIGIICIPPAHGITRRGTLYLWMARFAAFSILITMHIVLSNRFFDRDYHVRKCHYYLRKSMILIRIPSIVPCVAIFHACHWMALVDWIRLSITCIGWINCPGVTDSTLSLTLPLYIPHTIICVRKLSYSRMAAKKGQNTNRIEMTFYKR